ncbi:hypothetical protein Trydic_g17830 [Trypoxylus dichotomus]
MIIFVELGHSYECQTENFAKRILVSVFELIQSNLQTKTYTCRRNTRTSSQISRNDKSSQDSSLQDDRPSDVVHICTGSLNRLAPWTCAFLCIDRHPRACSTHYLLAVVVKTATRSCSRVMRSVALGSGHQPHRF